MPEQRGSAPIVLTSAAVYVSTCIDAQAQKEVLIPAKQQCWRCGTSWNCWPDQQRTMHGTKQNLVAYLHRLQSWLLPTRRAAGSQEATNCLFWACSMP
jgi:hypothetical protein